MMVEDIRPSPIAGSWYAGQADSLRAQITDYLGDSIAPLEFPPLGLLAPHAGMRFSGAVAGQAFRYIAGQHYDLVVVIGPSHYPYAADLITTGHAAYQTPLGIVPVATELLSELGRHIPILPIKNDPEHAIEIELPFLQVQLGDFRLLPLAMLDQSYEAAYRLAQALLELLAGQNVLYVASSDLSHFYTQTRANQLDEQVLDAINAYHVEGIIEAEADGRGIACGRGAIAAVMLACQPCASEVVSYATSGDVSGDMGHVVGYGSAIFYDLR